MKFTVLGASGFIGSSLVASLTRAGRECWAPARGARAVLSRPLGHVIYCVGVTSDYRRRPLDAMEAHVAALLPLLRRARFDSFLYLSSTRVYHGASGAAEDAALAIRPQEPADLYGISKLAGESACLALPRPAIRVVRLSNVYGAADRSENFLTSVVGDALSSGKVVFRSSPSSSKDYISLDDVVGLLPRLATSGRERLYNLASGENTTNAEAARLLGRLTGCRTSFASGAPRLVFPRISTKLIRKEFSFRPTSFPDGFAKLIEESRINHASERRRGKHP